MSFFFAISKWLCGIVRLHCAFKPLTFKQKDILNINIIKGFGQSFLTFAADTFVTSECLEEKFCEQL